LDFAVALEKQGVFGDGLFDQLLEHEHFRAVDDGVDAVLEGFHRGKGLKGVAQQDNGGVAAQGHRHGLQRLQGGVFLEVVRAKQFLDDHDLITDLAEAHQEIAVRGGGVDLVTQSLQRDLDRVEPVGRGKSDQRGLVARCDKLCFKVASHGYLSLSETATSPARCDGVFIFSEPTSVVTSPRSFLMRSMARETTPRLVQ